MLAEITAPVGSWESLSAAVQAKAHSVYFGLGKLNMRSRSSANFQINDLEQIIATCRQNNMKAYLTLNTIVYDNELPEIQDIIAKAAAYGVDAIIASDLAVITHVHRAGVPVHISTQCNVTNYEALSFYSTFANTVVLSRELNLYQVKAIKEQIQKNKLCGPSGKPIQLEAFVHGALCMAVSGKCYLSLDNMAYSANRGACLQVCRRSYLVTDKEDGYELEVDNAYIMSPKDLCTIGFLDKILASGLSILKIEGRGRPADYVKTTVSCYREALEAIEAGTYSQDKIESWKERLSTVFNRGFWDGYYMGAKIGEWSEVYGSRATKHKTFIGKVNNYFSNIGVVEIQVETEGISVGDEMVIMGPTTGVVSFVIEEIRVDLKAVSEAKKGEVCSLKVPEPVRRMDKTYKLSIRETEGIGTV